MRTMVTQLLLNSLIVIFRLCLASDRRNGLELEKRLAANILLRIHGESLMACQDSCSNRPGCKSINYHRLSHQCELMSASSASLGMAEDKSGWIHQSNPEWETEDVCKTCPENGVCDTHSRDCAIQECRRFPDATDSQTLGNTNSVGARAVLACPEGQYPKSPETISQWPVTSECQAHGNWTTWDLECANYTANCDKYLVSKNEWTRYLHKDVPLVSGPCGVPDINLNASSVFDNSYPAKCAKFEHKNCTWIAKSGLGLSNHYIEVEFASIIEVHRVETTGRLALGQFVSSFNITYSNDTGCPNSSFVHKAFNEKGQHTFVGNQDDTSIKENKIVPLSKHDV